MRDIKVINILIKREIEAVGADFLSKHDLAQDCEGRRGRRAVGYLASPAGELFLAAFLSDQLARFGLADLALDPDFFSITR